MSRQLTQEQIQLKTLLRSALAAAAPAVVAFVALISANAVDLLQIFHLGRVGMAAMGVLAVSLGHLLWRGRWWAGLPSLAAAAVAVVYFAFKFARPMAAYLAANPINSLGDVLHPLVMLSPSLVVVVICVGLVMAIYKGTRLARAMGPRPVGRSAWVIFFVWLALLGGDLVYQQSGWRLVKSPDDLVVRLCQPQVREEAQRYLLEEGPGAVPALLTGMAAKDPDLECMRRGSLQVLAGMGSAALEPLIQAAGEGKVEALVALQALGDRRAARPLLEIYRRPKPPGGPEFQAVLRQTIQKLNPALNLD